jgi:hypothetical protein
MFSIVISNLLTFLSMRTVTLLYVTLALQGPPSFPLATSPLPTFRRGFDAENDTMTEYVQTRWYRAPELLCDSSHYGRVSNFLLSLSLYLLSDYFSSRWMFGLLVVSSLSSSLMKLSSRFPSLSLPRLLSSRPLTESPRERTLPTNWKLLSSNWVCIPRLPPVARKH